MLHGRRDLQSSSLAAAGARRARQEAGLPPAMAPSSDTMVVRDVKLDAAAFQDQLVRRMNLGALLRPRISFADVNKKPSATTRATAQQRRATRSTGGGVRRASVSSGGRSRPARVVAGDAGEQESGEGGRSDNQQEQQQTGGRERKRSDPWMCWTCSVVRAPEESSCPACGSMAPPPPATSLDSAATGAVESSAEVGAGAASETTGGSRDGPTHGRIRTKRKRRREGPKDGSGGPPATEGDGWQRQLEERQRWEAIQERERKAYQLHHQRQAPAKLTLAQIRGLEPKPEARLTPDQWSELEGVVEARGRGDDPCTICREGFKDEQQILLSCGHLFHRACLSAFESFLKRTSKAARCCPVCRKENYQKTLTATGGKAWRNACALVLQRHVRGFAVRKTYRNMQRAFYSSVAATAATAAGGGGGVGKGIAVDPARRRAFFGKELGRYTERVTRDLVKRADSLDALFAQFDVGLTLSRHVFGVSSGRGGDVQQQQQEEGEEKEGRGEGAARGGGEGDAEENMGASEGKGRRGSQMGEEAWAIALTRAQERDDECPICMVDLKDKGEEGGLKPSQAGVCDGGRRNGGGGDLSPTNPTLTPTPARSCILLSCSHMFHTECLRAFERFNIYEVQLCPVCRGPYESIGVGELLRIVA